MIPSLSTPPAYGKNDMCQKYPENMKKKCGSYLLDSTANPAHFHLNWAGLADWSQKSATGLNMMIDCSSKRIWVTRLLFCQNDSPRRGVFCQKDGWGSNPGKWDNTWRNLCPAWLSLGPPWNIHAHIFFLMLTQLRTWRSAHHHPPKWIWIASYRCCSCSRIEMDRLCAINFGSSVILLLLPGSNGV